MSSSDFAESVEEFFADFRVQRLLNLARESRPLQICYPREVPVSRFLAWFFDPSQGHGLGDAPLRGLLKAVWRNSEEDMQVALRDQINPIALRNYSFNGCLVQTHAHLKAERAQIDVLVLDPKHKLLIAVENKTGAVQSSGQLRKYAKALKSRYPEWTRVLVFLDFHGNQPDDRSWVGLDYDWLVEELKEAELLPWLGSDCKSVIREFRQVLQYDGNTFSHINEDDDVLLEVAQRHRAVLEQFAHWQRQPSGQLSDLVSEVFTTPKPKSHEIALQQLLTVFWQRYELWEVCTPMLSYASYFKAAREEFATVLMESSRKASFYCLPKWIRFAKKDAEYWPVHSQVRKIPMKEDTLGAMQDQGFFVGSYLRVDALRPEFVDAVPQAVSKLMKRKRNLGHEPGWVRLLHDKVSDDSEVGRTLVRHLGMLDNALSVIS